MRWKTKLQQMALVAGLLALFALPVLAEGSREAGAGADDLEELGFRESGYPIVAEPVTIEAVIVRPGHIPNPYSELEMIQRLEEKTNVIIDFEEIPQQQAEERVNLMFASREFPDVFFNTPGLSYDNIWTAAQGGDIVRLDDYLEDYAPNWHQVLEENPLIRKAIEFEDGHIYSLPYSRDIAYDYKIRDIQLINIDWMQQLGLKMPETLNELRDVLRAFRDGIDDGMFPRQASPWYFRFRAVVGGEFELYGAFGLYTYGPDMISVNEEREVEFAATNPRMADAIAYLHEMYAEGLFPEEVFTDPWDSWVTRIQSDPPVTGLHGAYWNYDWSLEKGYYDALPPVPAPGTDRPVFRSQQIRLQPNQFTLMSKFEYPEIAMRWINQTAEPATAYQMSYGRIGHEVIREGDKYRQVGGSEEYLQVSPVNFIAAFIPKSFTENVIWEDPQAAARNYYAEEIYGPYVWPQERHWPRVRMTREEQEEHSILETEIVDYITSTHARWITRGGVREEWDEYLAELEDIGYLRWLEIRQAALDRFYAE
jgi:putative aldouronate transport system substrate-binding protein